jgi:hypothetical protein
MKNIRNYFYEKELEQNKHLFKSAELLEVKLAGGVSFDYDDTLSTERGKTIAKQLLGKGVDLHIITRRQESDLGPVIKVGEELGINRNKIHATNGKLKWELIKRLGITKHYDNNPKELEAITKNLPNVKVVQFSLEEY